MQPITFGVNFIVRNERVDKHGLIPLYCKITINGQVLKISLNQNILAKNGMMNYNFLKRVARILKQSKKL